MSRSDREIRALVNKLTKPQRPHGAKRTPPVRYGTRCDECGEWVSLYKDKGGVLFGSCCCAAWKVPAERADKYRLY